MGGTTLPLVILPEVVWPRFSCGLTLEGQDQCVVKNLAIIGSALGLGGTVRGGRLIAKPIEES